VGDRPVSDVSPRHIDGYMAHRLKKVNAVTVNIELRSLRAAMGRAVRWGLVNERPAGGCTQWSMNF
jgi:hypothetical protein